MKTSDLLSLSTRMFKTRPMRTFLTVLGVGVGIGTVLFLVSLGYGLQEIILGRIANADSLLTLDVTPGPSEDLALDDESVKELAAIPGVAEVSRLKNFSAELSSDSLTTYAQVSGVDDSFYRLKGIVPAHGSVYQEGAVASLIVSSAAALLFNETAESIVGKSLSIALSLPADAAEQVRTVPLAGTFTVVGVIDDENASYVYMPLRGLSEVLVTSYDQVEVKMNANNMMDEVRTIILSKGFVVSALSDTIEQANKIFRAVQIILALFGLVALVVSAIGMFNTMTITLLERTNEIGIMRAIGIRRSDIRKLFLVESMLMGLLGGMGGVLIGIVTGWIANGLINILATRLGGEAQKLFHVPLWFVLVIILFSTFIGFFTGVYPSRRASRLNPLDALRYK